MPPRTGLAHLGGLSMTFRTYPTILQGLPAPASRAEEGVAAAYSFSTNQHILQLLFRPVYSALAPARPSRRV